MRALLFTLGLIFCLSPFSLAILLQNYDIRLWIISGPYPFSNFGGGPFILGVGIALFIAGILCLLASFLAKKINVSQ